MLRPFTAIPTDIGAESPIALSKKPTSVPVRTSVTHLSARPFGSNLVGTPARNFGGLSGESGNEEDRDKVVDLINIKFAEAREEIEMAMESKETVYFNEEAECARAAVKDVVDLFEGSLAKLPESERAALQRSMGLKIEQLKAELKLLDD